MTAAAHTGPVETAPARDEDTLLPLVVEDLGFDAGGRRLIDGVCLRLEPRGRTLVLGPNGAGKSLLVRLLHGLLEPTRGRLRWHTEDTRRVRRAQALVFQRPVLLRRSVRANVHWALAARDVPRARRREISDRVLEATGLALAASQPARTLSGGEQQRLALARAWSVEPEVLFLDEPTANLDPAGVAAVEALIRQIDASGSRIVMTTQDLGQARRLADDVVFMHRGHCLEHTPAPGFFDAPRSREARIFLEGGLLP